VNHPYHLPLPLLIIDWENAASAGEAFSKKEKKPKWHRQRGYIYTHTYIHIHIYVYVYMYVYIYIYMYKYVYLYVCILICAYPGMLPATQCGHRRTLPCICWRTSCRRSRRLGHTPVNRGTLSRNNHRERSRTREGFLHFT
jgi:hypothetical protein